MNGVRSTFFPSEEILIFVTLRHTSRLKNYQYDTQYRGNTYIFCFYNIIRGYTLQATELFIMG